MRFVRLKIGALVVYAVTCVVLSSPAGSRLSNRSVWDSQHNEDEFEAWASGLRNLGLNLSGRQFQDLLWNVTNTYLDQRNRRLAPLAQVTDQLGFAQGWRMFSNPQSVTVQVVGRSRSRRWIHTVVRRGFGALHLARRLLRAPSHPQVVGPYWSRRPWPGVQ